MNLGQAHKTGFWYLLVMFSKFSDEHPRHFYRGVPPGNSPCFSVPTVAVMGGFNCNVFYSFPIAIHLVVVTPF